MKADSDMLETTCKNFEEDLVLHYYGDDSDADRSRVERHLQECQSCRRFLDDLRRLLPQMAKPKELPTSFWDNYYRETVEKLGLRREPVSWWRDLLAPMRIWVVPALGTATVAVLALALVLGKNPLNFQSDLPQANIPKEILADTNQLEFFKSLDMLESLRLLEALERTNKEPETI